MRIAISGSHSLGKSTFVQDFLETHPDYAFEEEPYRSLRHYHDIKFAEDQTQAHISLQLNYCIEQLKKYQAGENVICDRCPADYIPYASYTVDYGHTDIDNTFIQSLFPLVRHSLRNLDLIVFIPISRKHPIALENDGHRPTHALYREWVDHAFKTLYRKNLKTIMPETNPPKVIEIVGNRQARLKQLDEIIKRKNANNDE